MPPVIGLQPHNSPNNETHNGYVMKTHITLALFSISMFFLSGCLSRAVIKDYGQEIETFTVTGPAHGDATRIYAQGERTRSVRRTGKQHTDQGYLLIYANGQWSKPKKGSIPLIALEYPEIPKIDPSGLGNRDSFIQSGQDNGFGDRVFFFRNPENPNSPMIHFPPVGWYYRPFETYIYIPFVLIGAVMIDAVVWPFEIFFERGMKGLH